jgi:hypothetical protein
VSGQSERVRSSEHLATDRTEPRDPDGAPMKARGFAVFALLPFSGAKLERRIGNPPVEGEEETHGELGHRGGVFARAVGDVDGTRTGRADVDGVHTRAGAHDEVQTRGGGDDLGGHSGRANDEDADFADRGGELFFVEPGPMFDVETERSEISERALRKRIDHEHMHGSAKDTSARSVWRE